MSKKNRREKEVARLRRELEFLKTQIQVGSGDAAEGNVGNSESAKFNLPSLEKRATEKVTTQEISSKYELKTATLDYSYLKKDLQKTAVLAAGAFASIFLLYFLGQRGRIF